MAYDLTRLGLCGSIYLLPGWSRSKGATIEKDLASALGMHLQFDPDAERVAASVPPTGGEVIGGIDVGAASVLRFWAEDAHNIRCVRAEDFDTHVIHLQSEVQALSHWRDLALQFDNHRMAAMGHLKSVIADPHSLGSAKKFISAPPAAAHEVVAERDALKAENEALQQFKTSYMEWHDKTDSLLQGFEASELGRHRADVLRSRFQRLQAEKAALHERLTVADQRVDDLHAEVAKLRRGPCELIYGDELP